jgi:N-acetylglucosaminyldiphosphoundecaprenol N-acetyl-beta-D-mannosaminyltransferase
MDSPRYSASEQPDFRVLGIRVHAVQIPDVILRMREWIVNRSSCHFIAVTGMHGIMEAQHDITFKETLNAADLVVPDGMPLVWIGRHRGIPLRRRVYGPELMEAFFSQTSDLGYRHFFYGGAPDVARELAERFASRFPGFQIAGTYCPPFRELTESENRQIVDLIQRSAADVLWVGLSTPKQERWMRSHREMLDVPVLIGVGAAFDFHTGRVSQAPRWMRENGLEWLYRLCSEPRRLWHRYIVYGSQFIWLLVLESLGLKEFPE